MVKLESNKGYEEEAENLTLRYDTYDVATIYQWFTESLRKPPAKMLDIGAGSGRDALYFSSLGYDVTAVEPTDAFLKIAKAKEGAEKVLWIEDALPALEQLDEDVFDVVTMIAVYMHFDELERKLVMLRVASLMNKGAHLAMTVRHGKTPEGRCMYEISDEEVIDAATASGLKCVYQAVVDSHQDVNRARGVKWSRLLFEKE
ncbi:class I SAM-dependent methyltransferase [uncultured Cohaesibacter sp.]|uniref:class I SAM-dependent methyltransferase n=1 Tax=uncultured Cohaesibacter sp. TaxID=1002546 RepID=UPI002930579B|nr:class I SAM-dependent methyltransferase [uncultured Cohaesibacter sp.]